MINYDWIIILNMNLCMREEGYTYVGILNCLIDLLIIQRNYYDFEY
ncbi:hypothetical protein SBF1_2880005 [Candidatus Desulfosporosinus infrequens]|uniref:Uncharacterized protein n=1 Tax=Candidatus Desulfosporosinus infrequens TaxID=2043169 RepID=A0A2U3KUZ0_9FIRM|nr:hypothetical protein SBF1_2880005 [Candidatus Desulfosporosinus infrequens]